MFQYYLRAAGLALSWIGTGRLIFSLNYSDADFEAVADRFLAAAEAMRRDGWWEPGALATDKAIKRRILREMLGQLLFLPSDAGDVSTHLWIRLLSPARGRGWERGLRTSIAPSPSLSP